VVVGKLAGLWTFDQPALISVPASFVSIAVVSLLTYERQPMEVKAALEAAFHALHVPEPRVPPPPHGQPTGPRLAVPPAGAADPALEPVFETVPADDE
jgi:hypothetical protein